MALSSMSKKNRLKQPTSRTVQANAKPLANQSVKSVDARHGWRKRILGAISFVLALIGAAGVIALRPGVEIESTESRDQANPFDQQFSVRNPWYLNISNVSARCIVLDAVADGTTIRGLSVTNLREGKVSAVTVLEPHSSLTATCPMINAMDMTFIRTPEKMTYRSLNIAIRVEYKSLLWSQCRAERFRGVSTRAGTFIWNHAGSYPCDGSH